MADPLDLAVIVGGALLGWNWHCLRCNADGFGYIDRLAMAAAIAHPCADQICAQEARDE